MSDVFDMKPNNYDVRTVRATSVDVAIAEAIEFAAERERAGMPDKGEFSFRFNDECFVVRSDSSPELLKRDWDRMISDLVPVIEGRSRNIGPYPKPKLDKEQLALEGNILKARQGVREARDALVRYLCRQPAE